MRQLDRLLCLSLMLGLACGDYKPAIGGPQPDPPDTAAGNNASMTVEGVSYTVNPETEAPACTLRNSSEGDVLRIRMVDAASPELLGLTIDWADFQDPRDGQWQSVTFLSLTPTTNRHAVFIALSDDLSYKDSPRSERDPETNCTIALTRAKNTLAGTLECTNLYAFQESTGTLGTQPASGNMELSCYYEDQR